MESLVQFVDKLVDEKGFTDLTPEVLVQIKADLLVRVEDKINLTILQNLSPTKLTIFDKLLDDGADEPIQEFCQNNIDDFEQVLAVALLEFRRIYLNL